jgi:hypothetical protein
MFRLVALRNFYSDARTSEYVLDRISKELRLIGSFHAILRHGWNPGTPTPLVRSISMAGPPSFAAPRLISWLVCAVSAAGIALAVVPESSPADVCVSGPVHLKVQGTLPVATTIPMTLRADDCAAGVTYDGRLFGSVRVGGRHYGVHAVTFVNLGTTIRALTIRMPSRNVSAARAYAKRRDLRYGYLYLTARTSEHGTNAYPNGGSYKIRLVAFAGGRRSR